MSISSLGSVGFSYTPQFTSRPYQGPEDFEPGLVMPKKEPEEKKNGSSTLKTVAKVALFVGGAIVLKKYGKGIWNKLKGVFNKGAKAATEGAKVASEGAKTATGAAATVTTPASKADVIKKHTQLRPNGKVKMTDGGGKEVARKVRHNKKQIIEQTKLQEELEAFTTKDLDAYQKTLGTPATEAERTFITKNNKEATNSMADIMEAQGIKRGKNKSGRVVLEQTKEPKAEAPKPTPAPVVTPSARATEIQDEIKKLDATIEKNSKPGMERWAKPAQARKAKLEAELSQLQHPAKVQVTPEVAPSVKKGQIDAAWAEMEKVNPPKPQRTPVAPTSNEIWAQTEADAAKMAKEEKEVLAKMFPED